MIGGWFISTDAETDLLREMNQRPLRNGRFLSPDCEGRRRDQRLEFYSVYRIARVRTHDREHTCSPDIVDIKMSGLGNNHVT